MDNESPDSERPPSADSPAASKLLFLQERMVNFTQQYSMPVVEVSLVVSKYTKQISMHLSTHASEQGEKLPLLLSQPWPLESGDSAADAGGQTEFALDKVLDMVDGDRIDIFDEDRDKIDRCLGSIGHVNTHVLRGIEWIHEEGRTSGISFHVDGQHVPADDAACWSSRQGG